MTTYKVIVRNQVFEKSEDEKQKHLLVARGRGGMLAIPCYKIETEVVQSGMSFKDAKELRKTRRNSVIVKE